jgi:hypothetical protein
MCIAALVAGVELLPPPACPRFALGLTSVHTNRVLQGFRRDELTALERQRLILRDIERLQAISGLTPDYLKLSSTPPEVLRYFDDLERDRAAPPRPRTPSVLVPKSHGLNKSLSLRGARRATRQSPTTSLRCRRDCFAALAMTTSFRI